MNNNNKMDRVVELISKANVFDGRPLIKYTLEQVKKEGFDPDSAEFEQQFLCLQEKSNIFYLPKTAAVTRKIGESFVDAYAANFGKYAAGGLEFRSLSKDDVDHLKDTFGLAISIAADLGVVESFQDAIQPSKPTSEESQNTQLFKATLFTHVRQKGIVEKTIGRTLGTMGIAASATATTGFAVAGVVFSNPVTAVLMFPEGVSGVAAGVAAFVLSMQLLNIPQLIQSVLAKFKSGDKQATLEFVKTRYSDENQSSADFDESIKVEKINVIKNMRTMRRETDKQAAPSLGM